MFLLISFLIIIKNFVFPQDVSANCSLKKGVGGPGGCPNVPQLNQLQEQINSTHDYNRSQIETIVNQRNYAGKYWLIGNEPDNTSQDNLTPAQAAQKYGEIAYLIKEIDPTAKLIMLGLQYPESWWKTQFLNAWQQRWLTSDGYASAEQTITGWHVHIYAHPWSGETWEETRERVKTKLGHWIGNSSSDKELWVTEYGCFYRKDPTAMIDLTNFLEGNPRVNRYAYFYFGEPNPGNFKSTSLYTNDPWPSETTLASRYASLPENPQSSCVLPTPTPDTTCDCQGSSRAQRQGGDYDCSGGVNLSDLILWVNCHFWGGNSSSCDHNCDGQANMGDYNTWWNGFEG